MDIESIKRDIIFYGLEIKRVGLVVGTWGNISARYEDKVLITPSGIPYEKLSPEDIVICDLNCNVLEGRHIPSTELSTHVEIYKHRDDVKSIIHTHSIYASAIAVTRKNIPAIIEDMAMIIGGEVPCAKYAFPGTMDLAENVLEVLENKNAVLLANHGAISMGRSIKEAFNVCQILEKSAQIYIFATQIGMPKPLAIEEVEKMREIYLNKYSKNDEAK
ncbi:L-fuculose phosphate aldolase [Caloramator mitchellensis]|uniref:L-fuculose phosphate aldolase n=1 Tax=Caloramator mitchellensis TaxID=908809 RepID=A0A0R3JX69_CALMK|nr:class II aldolase/adducin family protein [Caloramator mitchellensis]KRQ88113.1 L-fuculose phosphate aldolase [Caloramator mitchellensis]